MSTPERHNWKPWKPWEQLRALVCHAVIRCHTSRWGQCWSFSWQREFFHGCWGDLLQGISMQDHAGLNCNRMTWWLVKKCSMKLLWSSEHAWVLPGSCECRQNEGYRVSQWLDVLCGSLGPDLGQFCAVPMATEMLRYCSSDSGPLRSGFRWQCFRLQKNSSRPWGKAWCASWVCVVELTRATFDSQASWFQRVVLCLRLEQSCVDLWLLLPNLFNPHQTCVWFGHSSGTLDFWAVGTNCCGTTGTPPLGCYTMLQSHLECVCVCGSVLCGFDAVKNRACASWQSVAVKVFLLWCSQPLCAIWPAGVGWHAYCAHLNQ